ncbi:hypothetical protein MD588_08410 [Photobacterium sp. SDRW27]|uniref:hypothetical protein n=1 Tax=Photobacterium obscurum TaxID=2829490 RepID=UPI0022448CD2|nr:hypothetical protein [Photobacterium obscurum]MCW8328830.1 hypothetical protein [Photobacterium obscurum]
MRKFIILSITLALASCALTPQKLRTSKPVLEQDSLKSPEHMAVCIADGWENIDYIIYSPVVGYRPTSSGYEVTQFIDGVLTHLADIESDSSGSKVKIYTESLNLGKDSAVSAVERCGLEN